MKPLLVATRNAHKTREIREILGNAFAVTDLAPFPDFPETAETGRTFAENAIIKAMAASALCEHLVLADDSGLEVDALGGAPGVLSARYAGLPADDARNRRKLLAELERAGARGKARSARFRCLLALVRQGDVIATFDGVVEGIIANQERGEGGFGYDALFIPEGYCETFGQLPAAVKNGISHRWRALEKMREWLECTNALSTTPVQIRPDADHSFKPERS
jgi:XTP/dITP diphosphohydrolase